MRDFFIHWRDGAKAIVVQYNDLTGKDNELIVPLAYCHEIDQNIKLTEIHLDYTKKTGISGYGIAFRSGANIALGVFPSIPILTGVRYE